MSSRRREKRKLCQVAEPSSGSDADTKPSNTSKRLRVSDQAAVYSSDTTNTCSSKRRRVSHHAAVEPSSDTTNTSSSKRRRVSHHAAGEPSSDTTNTSSSKRRRVSHHAAGEPSSDTTNTSSSKKPAVSAPDGSSGQTPCPGGQHEGKAPDASRGPSRKRRCCRRCLQLTNVERRAWRRLRAAGVPLLTQCEVLAMHSGDGGIIGKGVFGTCVKGRDPRTGHEVVLKSFHWEGLESLEHEAATLWALRRVPGLQRLVGACVQTNQLVSLFAGESLNKYFDAKPRRSAATALSVFQQAARTLQAMDEAGYAHNDINLWNVCARDQEGRSGPEVTVIDVGISSSVGSGGVVSDAYALALLMDKVLDRVKHRPSLAPVLAWMNRASSRDPHARPGLAELQEVLQKALAEEGMH